MLLEIDFKRAGYDFSRAVADAVGCNVADVDAVVYPAKDVVPLCADWRIVSEGCADAVVYIRGEIMLLNIV